jgi:hypothetical protein
MSLADAGASREAQAGTFDDTVADGLRAKVYKAD